jgi:hypothetical protein
MIKEKEVGQATQVNVGLDGLLAWAALYDFRRARMRQCISQCYQELFDRNAESQCIEFPR